MYCAILTKKNAKGEERSEKYNFVGKLTDEVQKQWENIARHSDFKVDLIPYTNEKEKNNG